MVLVVPGIHSYVGVDQLICSALPLQRGALHSCGKSGPAGVAAAAGDPAPLNQVKFGRVTETQQGNTDRGTTGT